MYPANAADNAFQNRVSQKVAFVYLRKTVKDSERLLSRAIDQQPAQVTMKVEVQNTCVLNLVLPPDRQRLVVRFDSINFWRAIHQGVLTNGATC